MTSFIFRFVWDVERGYFSPTVINMFHELLADDFVQAELVVIDGKYQVFDAKRLLDSTL